jgi:hypothetical protein
MSEGQSVEWVRGLGFVLSLLLDWHVVFQVSMEAPQGEFATFSAQSSYRVPASLTTWGNSPPIRPCSVLRELTLAGNELPKFLGDPRCAAAVVTSESPPLPPPL